MIRKFKNLKQQKKQKNFNLLGNPQKKCICLKILTISPKKPNSANRRVAKVKMLQTKKHLTVKVPGEKHNLQQHSFILIHTGRIKDLIGVYFKAIRGTFDLTPVQNRKTSRSVYGVKKF